MAGCAIQLMLNGITLLFRSSFTQGLHVYIRCYTWTGHLNRTLCTDNGPTACRNVEALQAFSKNWLPLLFTAFLTTKTGQRGTISSTIAAYAAISEQSLLTGLFHTTLKKFLKVPLLLFPL